MIEVVFLSVIAILWLAFASVQDLRRHEVFNWISFSLVIFALGFRFFYSLFSGTGFGFFYQGIIGFAIFFAIGNLFYYSRLFAGGDTKLMYAMGAILPFSTGFISNLKAFGSYLFMFLVLGAVYGLFWSLFLMFKNFRSFRAEFGKQFRGSKKYAWGGVILGIIFVALGFFEGLFVLLGVLIFVLPYFYFYAKAVDEVCMVNRVPVSELTEGDWLYEDVGSGKGKIKTNWEGLSMTQIKKIRKKFKFVKIRSGIPFIPVFLIAFLVWLYLLRNPLW